METFSALLAFCAGNSPVTGEFPTQRPVTRSFDVTFDLRPNKPLSKQSWGWWFETLSRSLWCHCNENNNHSRENGFTHICLHEFCFSWLRLNIQWPLQWRHNEQDGASNHRHLNYLLNRLFKRRSKKTSNSASLGIHQRPVDSPNKRPMSRKIFPFDDVIMTISLFYSEIVTDDLAHWDLYRSINILQAIFSNWLSHFIW